VLRKACGRHEPCHAGFLTVDDRLTKLATFDGRKSRSHHLRRSREIKFGQSGDRYSGISPSTVPISPRAYGGSRVCPTG